MNSDETNTLAGVGESGVKDLFGAGGGVHVLVVCFFCFVCGVVVVTSQLLSQLIEVCLRFLPRFDAISHSKFFRNEGNCCLVFAFLIFFPSSFFFICERC